MVKITRVYDEYLLEGIYVVARTKRHNATECWSSDPVHFLTSAHVAPCEMGHPLCCWFWKLQKISSPACSERWGGGVLGGFCSISLKLQDNFVLGEKFQDLWVCVCIRFPAVRRRTDVSSLWHKNHCFCDIYSWWCVFFCFWVFFREDDSERLTEIMT